MFKRLFLEDIRFEVFWNMINRLFIFFLFFLIFFTNTEALRTLQPINEVVEPDIISFGIPGTADNPLSIQEWNNSTFENAATEVFETSTFTQNPHSPNFYINSRGIVERILRRARRTINIPNGNETDEFISMICHMSRLSFWGYNVPHIAIARILVFDTENNAYAYSIPYLFLSGSNYNNAFDRWFSNEIVHILEAHTNGLSQICKVINDFGVSDPGAGSYCHSERAIGLFLAAEYLQAIVNLHNRIYPHNIAQNILIQIKTSLKMCNSCQNFWYGDAWIKEAMFRGRNAGERARYDLPALLNAIIPFSLRVTRRNGNTILGL